MPAARTADVQTFLNEHPFSRFQWLFLGSVFGSFDLGTGSTPPQSATSLIVNYRMGTGAAGWICSECGSVRLGGRCPFLVGAVGRSPRSQGSAVGLGANHGCCLPHVRVSAGAWDQLVVWRFIMGVGLGAAMPMP